MVWNWLIQEAQKQPTRAASENFCINTRITSEIKTFYFLKCKGREKFMQILANSNLLSISFRWFELSNNFQRVFYKRFFIFVFRFAAHESLICKIMPSITLLISSWWKNVHTICVLLNLLSVQCLVLKIFHCKISRSNLEWYQIDMYGLENVFHIRSSFNI